MLNFMAKKNIYIYIYLFFNNNIDWTNDLF